MKTIDEISMGDLDLFLDVAREGSFAAAGRRRGTARSIVSRTIARMEQRLGAKLFTRTTRALRLTRAGEELWSELDSRLPELLDVLSEAGAQHEQTRGVVKLSMSRAFGQAFVLPALATLLDEHPDLALECDISDEVRDLTSLRIDVAVRIGPLPDSAMIARSVGRLEQALVASPSLAKRLKTPRSLKDVAHVPSVCLRLPSTGVIAPWGFAEGGTVRRIQPTRIRAVVNSIEGVAKMAKLGIGVGLVPTFLVGDEIASGALVVIASPPVAPGSPVHLCYQDRRAPRRVRVVLDHLAAAFEQMPR